MKNIIISQQKELTIEEKDTEVVERKGLGHPDTICDAVMEEASLALNEFYLKNFGQIFHYNLDKGLLAAGRVKKKFAGGKVIEPLKIIFGDRATSVIKGKKLPIQEIAIEVTQKWFKNNFRFLDPQKHLTYQWEVKSGSEQLKEIFFRKKKVHGANDTSALVGYAPLSETEKIVFKTEKFLNSPEFKKHFPETGEDVKILGIRLKDKLHLTIAMPMIDYYITSEADYFKKKEKIKLAINEFITKNKEKLNKIDFSFNTLDQRGKGLGSMYLTVVGTSAEDADSGEVGRGNRVNGLIALNRPTCTEAAAGKNPVSHIGKIYNVFSHRLANIIYERIPQIKQIYLWLCSEIGTPVNQPKLISVELILKPKVSFNDISTEVKDIIQSELANLDDFCQDLIAGKYTVY